MEGPSPGLDGGRGKKLGERIWDAAWVRQRLRPGEELPPDAPQMPDCAWPLYATRLVNRTLRTAYTVEQVMAFEVGELEVLSAVAATVRE